MSLPTYATVEQVKRAANFDGPDEEAAIKRLLEGASREIERQCHRHFYPLTATRLYDFPSVLSPTWKLYLNADLIEATALVSTDAITDFFEEPNNYGPPFSRLEIDLGSSASFQSGDSWQRSIAVTGRWGYSEDSEAAGALAEALDASETGVDVTDSSLVGIGDLVLVGTERMVVTAKSLLTTGTTASAVAADNAVVTVPVGDGTVVKQGEIITIDSERMYIESISGNNLTVKRAYDGSTLAAHSNGATVYAPRTLTVERGAVGTTAAAHDTASAITRNLPPGLITELAIAEVIYAREQEKGGFALTAGQGDGQREINGRGIADLRTRVAEAYRRRRP